MVGEGIADLLEAPPVDLRARGFRRVTRARRAWDKRISDDIVWRISIDGSAGRWEIVAGVVLTFFDAVRPFTTLIRAPYDWDEEVVRNPSARHGCVSIAWPVEGGRSGLPWSHRVPNARLARLVEEEVLPYLARFLSLMAVLDELLATRDRTSSKARGDSARYFASCEIALLKWRLGDIAGAEAELDRAAQSIVRLEYPSITLWPPSAWRATSDDDETLKFVEVTLGEQKAYIADLR
ncbi:MAG TPA: hypothetical protein VFK68_02725, partial [Propionibacteriaceae bacterium]|nr:hypothetical protein [Propionibacteriaceae bacterium]